jgi:hypothetical protein
VQVRSSSRNSAPIVYHVGAGEEGASVAALPRQVCVRPPNKTGTSQRLASADAMV